MLTDDRTPNPNPDDRNNAVLAALRVDALLRIREERRIAEGLCPETGEAGRQKGRVGVRTEDGDGLDNFNGCDAGARSSEGIGGRDVCALTLANLSAYQDNALDAGQERALEAHLDQCAGCAEVLNAIRATDSALKREWRDNAPLPSSLLFGQSVDSIMAALPPVPTAPTAFERKRVHARTRWMRFSTGLAGVFAFFTMLWSSYRLGYAHGRLSHVRPSRPVNSIAPSSQPGAFPSSPPASRVSVRPQFIFANYANYVKYSAPSASPVSASAAPVLTNAFRAAAPLHRRSPAVSRLRPAPLRCP